MSEIKHAPDRYRGTGEYFLVFAELVRAAKHRGTVTYQELADMIALPLTGNHMANELGKLLGEISDDQHRLGKPMLSAVVVTVDGTPGPGFFDMASKLGKFSGSTPAQQKQFWETEIAEVHKLWQQKFA